MTERLQRLATDDVRGWVDKFNPWFATEPESGNSPATRYAYGRTLAQFVAWLDDRPEAVVDRDLVREFTRRPRRNGTTGSQASRNRDIHALRRFWDYLIDEQELAINNPPKQLDTPEPDNIVPRYVKPKEWLPLWLHPKLMPDERVWLGLGFYAGLRRSDLDTILADDVDLDLQELKTFVASDQDLHGAKGRKSRIIEYGAMAELVIEVRPELGAHIHEWHRDIADLVRERQGQGLCLLPQATGGTDMNHSWVNHDLRRLLVMADLPADLWTPHSMKHSAATYLAQHEDVDMFTLARMLGHSNPKTTERYTDNAGTAKRLVRKRRQYKNR